MIKAADPNIFLNYVNREKARLSRIHRSSDNFAEEDLLEAICLLNSAIHYRLDNAMDKMLSDVSEFILPAWSKPLPASAVLSCELPERINHSVVLQEKSMVRFSEVTAGSQWQTTQSVTILPIRARKLQMSMTARQECIFSLQLYTVNSVNMAALDWRNFTIYITGIGSEEALELLQQNLIRVECFNPIKNQTFQLGEQSKFQSPHFEIQSNGVSHPALLDLYYHMHYSFLLRFLTLSGLETVPWQEFVTECELRWICHLKRPFHFKKDDVVFNLHTVPIVNLYPCSFEPILADDLMSEYPLIVQKQTDGIVALYELTDVRGLDHRTGRRVDFYNDYYAAEKHQNRFCFSSKRQIQSDGPSYLQVSLPEGERYTLSCLGLGCDQSVTADHKLGSAEIESFSDLRCYCIERPTTFRSAKADLFPLKALLPLLQRTWSPQSLKHDFIKCARALFSVLPCEHYSALDKLLKIEYQSITQFHRGALVRKIVLTVSCSQHFPANQSYYFVSLLAKLLMAFVAGEFEAEVTFILPRYDSPWRFFRERLV